MAESSEIGSEVTQRIRAAVKTKLIELGIYVDDELPDYIMVMIANKKSKESMKHDLSLFLGNNTVLFTDWLHEVLEHLKRYASETRKKLDVSTAAADLITTTVLQVASIPKENSVKEEEPEEYILQLKTGEQEDIDAGCDTTIEPSHMVPSTSAFSTVTSTTQPCSSESTRKRIVSLRHSSDDGKSGHKTRILSRVTKVKEIVPPRPSISSCIGGYVRRSRSRSSPRRALHSIISSNSAISRRNKVSIDDILQKNRVLSKAIQEATGSSKKCHRRGSSESLLRRSSKAGHKCEANRCPCRTVSTYLAEKCSDKVKIVGEAEEAADPHFTVTLEGAPQDMFSGALRDGDEEVQRLDRQHGARNSASQVLPIIINTPTVVTSTGVQSATATVVNPASVWSRIGNRVAEVSDEGKRTQITFNLDEEPMVLDEEPVTTNTDVIAAGDGKSLKKERCRFFPNCTAGTNCLYHHPTEPCESFPNCKSGKRCMFLHPVCNFNALCTKPDCPFTHTKPKNTAGFVATPGLPLPPQCKFFPYCTNLKCSFFHPKPCKFGMNCTAPRCPYTHPIIPDKRKLTWRSPALM